MITLLTATIADYVLNETVIATVITTLVMMIKIAIPTIIILGIVIGILIRDMVTGASNNNIIIIMFITIIISLFLQPTRNPTLPTPPKEPLHSPSRIL